jgi:3-methylfumaryl-CoA hydratase
MVSVSGAEHTLADAGLADVARAAVTREQAERLAACIDAEPTVLDTGALPLLWHWAAFLPLVPTAALGPDGHPRRRPEMEAFPQRMWVGGRVHVERPLALGTDAERASRIVRAEVKDGGRGRFWLVTVGHTVAQRGEPCIEEEQDLVFREAAAVAPPGPERDDAPDAAWVEARVADPVLLFRFSAVTANAHRIHYDHPYATGVEGYPDLVVHGPLTAVLLAELARRRGDQDWQSVSYRARAPHYANRRFWLTGSPTDDGADLAAVRADHTVAMTLEVR